MIIGLAIGVFTMKIVTVENLVLKAVKINRDDMYMEMDLIE